MTTTPEYAIVPDDILQTAEACYRECEQMDSYGIIATIAKAILAERERCAKVAEYAAKSSLSVETDGSGYYACEGVARDIRTPVQHTPSMAVIDDDYLPF